METHSATIRRRRLKRGSLDFSRDSSPRDRARGQDQSLRDLRKGGCPLLLRDSVNIFGFNSDMIFINGDSLYVP